MTASSQDTSTGQTAAKAIDGVVDGYPGDYTKEWATVGGGTGSWLKLTWTSSQTINDVVLYDRPNTNDQVTGGTLTFSDGSTVTVPALNNTGSATTVTFPTKITTSVLFTVTSVSSTTQNVGLGGDRGLPGAGRGWQQRTADGRRRGEPTRVHRSRRPWMRSASYDPGGNPKYQWSQTCRPERDAVMRPPRSSPPSLRRPLRPRSPSSWS